MSWKIDARIPVTIVEQPPALTAAMALLAEGSLPEGVGPPQPCAIFRAEENPGHPAACPCCYEMGAVAAALAELFRDRAMGGPWFSSVVALVRTPAGRAELEDALSRDVLTVARFRPA
jgi:hypothetical protein